jgi:hypothetical protein
MLLVVFSGPLSGQPETNFYILKRDNVLANAKSRVNPDAEKFSFFSSVGTTFY